MPWDTIPGCVKLTMNVSNPDGLAGMPFVQSIDQLREELVAGPHPQNAGPNTNETYRWQHRAINWVPTGDGWTATVYTRGYKVWGSNNWYDNEPYDWATQYVDGESWFWDGGWINGDTEAVRFGNPPDPHPTNPRTPTAYPNYLYSQRLMTRMVFIHNPRPLRKPDDQFLVGPFPQWEHSTVGVQLGYYDTGEDDVPAEVTITEAQDLLLPTVEEFEDRMQAILGEDWNANPAFFHEGEREWFSTSVNLTTLHPLTAAKVPRIIDGSLTGNPAGGPLNSCFIDEPGGATAQQVQVVMQNQFKMLAYVVACYRSSYEQAVQLNLLVAALQHRLEAVFQAQQLISAALLDTGALDQVQITE